METNRGLIAVMVVIGIIIIVLLLRPGYSTSLAGTYNYGNFAASALPYDISSNGTSNTTYTSNGVIRYIPSSTTSVDATTAPTTSTTYTYTTQQAPQYPDGCYSTQGYSTTTGYSCDGTGRRNDYNSYSYSNDYYNNQYGYNYGTNYNYHNYPSGCSSTYGYSTTNGYACDGSGRTFYNQYGYYNY